MTVPAWAQMLRRKCVFTFRMVLQLKFLTVFLAGLSTNWLTLPALGPRTLLPNGACYIDQLGERHVCLCLLLTSPLLSLLLFLLSSFPLSVAAAERLYSQLERNRLLSNELKLTLHGLCD